MRLPFLLHCAFLVLALRAAAQPGCPDPQANNFDPLATSNDGSCLYPATSVTPTLLSELPENLREISGIAQANTRWWTHNDSGFEEEFFRIDPQTGNILQTITLQNGQNRDWEDMAADSQHLYIGDFGNNTNDRQNLGIYVVPLSEIGNGTAETVPGFAWDFVPFSYIDQTDFATQPEDSTVFDCEAMVFYNGQAHLFTKSRRHYNTVHYAVDAPNQAASPLEQFDCQGLITGASLAPDGQLMALVGYDLRPFIPTVFCWLLWDWPPGTDQFFAGNKRRIELGTALQVGQVEGIGFVDSRKAYLSNERTTFGGVTIVDESLWAVDFGAWVPGSVGTGEPAENASNLGLWPNPFSQSVHFQWNKQEKPDFLRIKNQLGQTVLTSKVIPETLELGFLPSGFYVFEVWKDGVRTGLVKRVKQ